MKRWYEILLDEKIVLGMLFMICINTILILVYFHAEKDIIMAVLALAGIFGGALARGITHTQTSSNSSQAVSSTTTITPKE